MNADIDFWCGKKIFPLLFQYGREIALNATIALHDINPLNYYEWSPKGTNYRTRSNFLWVPGLQAPVFELAPAYFAIDS